MGADSIDRDKPGRNHPLRTKRAYLAAAIYSFIGLALMWQFAFVMITRDVHRYSALMPSHRAGEAGLWPSGADSLSAWLCARAGAGGRPHRPLLAMRPAQS